MLIPKHFESDFPNTNNTGTSCDTCLISDHPHQNAHSP